jgi:hypothetical protein
MLKKFAVGLIAVASLALSLFAADPAVGTWKLNVAKSKFAKGHESTDTTLVITVTGGIATVSAKGTGGFAGAGNLWTVKYTVPVAGGALTFTDPPPDVTQKMKKIDDLTADFITTIHGKQVLLQHTVISANHKTMTVTTTGVDEQGQQFKNVELLVRQ